MIFQEWFHQLNPTIKLASIDAVLLLSSEGGTIPFIARYRKEQTGNIDEVAIQAILENKEKWDELIKRQLFIIGEVERQQKLTPELKEKILATYQPEVLEDLYLPYKQKRKTKAALAKEAGLQPLADWIWNCGHGLETPLEGQTLQLWAFTFRNEEKGIVDAEGAIAGAQDILIERIAESQDLRQLVRTKMMALGLVKTEKGKKAKPHSKFENYFTFHETIPSLLLAQNTHRYLAMRRGWMEEELSLTLVGPDETFMVEILSAFECYACTQASPGADVLKKAARMALQVHVLPSIESEAHKTLRDNADMAAIKVFAENVRKLLLASPFGAQGVLGVDPGIRTGCKLAVVDESGKYIASTVMYLQSDEAKQKAGELLRQVVSTGSLRAVAVGNGTAGRETEHFIRQVFVEAKIGIPVVMVSESGASVYSASECAREEFPDLDLTVRGAISIARRLQDPLAELVKVDPKSIGVGQYQHDVSQTSLKKSLSQVVESCVNQVGVNLNTASYHLLSYVAGIGPALAKAIVHHRVEKGLFRSRQQLFDVHHFHKKAFEQAAGFLRIPGAENPLDNTGVHPENYDKLTFVANRLGVPLKDLMTPAGALKLKRDTEAESSFGTFTFQDILRELEKPGRDPREEFVPFQFREDIHTVADLKAGMLCPGIVTNVTNFGAFVDIGVHQDGLVHISQLSHKFLTDPREAVSPGDHVKVRVLEVLVDKQQISLSMKMDTKSASVKMEKPSMKTDKPKIEAAAKVVLSPRKTPAAAPYVRQEKKVFNNAFAGLASLRTQLKK